jgi:drug/metabolite transporter (DMT)-like permease
MISERVRLSLILIVMGAGWGVTQPLSKIAVSEGYRHLGIVFWQLLIASVLLGAICAVRRKPLLVGRAQIRIFLIIAFLGTILPGVATYEVARHLPSGWMSVILSTVPMFSFPIALLLGMDSFSWLRVGGLVAGLAGVLVLIWPTGNAAVIDASAVPIGVAFWVGLSVFSSVMYAMEGNIVARWGTAGLDAVQVLFGASVIGMIVVFPLAVISGSWISPLPPFGVPDLSIVLSSIIHAFVYAGYVWLVGRAGSVFAAQVSYLVTGFGVVWAMLILNESYGSSFWYAFGLMLVGLFLVQPRATQSALVLDGVTGQTDK